MPQHIANQQPRHRWLAVDVLYRQPNWNCGPHVESKGHFARRFVICITAFVVAQLKVNGRFARPSSLV